MNQPKKKKEKRRFQERKPKHADGLESTCDTDSGVPGSVNEILPASSRTLRGATPLSEETDDSQSILSTDYDASSNFSEMTSSTLSLVSCGLETDRAEDPTDRIEALMVCVGKTLKELQNGRSYSPRFVAKPSAKNEFLSRHPILNRATSEVRGLENGAYFVNHEFLEDRHVETGYSCNQFEAKYLVAFCIYLSQQGYVPEKILILTACEGQVDLISNLIKRENVEGVRIKFVDGKIDVTGECDIVMLSFVDATNLLKLLFLVIDSALNTVLANAACGVFCVGRFRHIALKSERWRDFVEMLESKSMIGDGLKLVCQKHLASRNCITNSSEFEKLAPCGGCLEVCGEQLPCGHKCVESCHLSKHSACCESCLESSTDKCSVPGYLSCKPCRIQVQKFMPNCKHVVQIPCCESVTVDLCSVVVKRTLPQCSHEAELSCHVNPRGHNCLTMVKIEFEECGHTVDVVCYLAEEKKMQGCTEPCRWRLKCGHQCSQQCHELYYDSEHDSRCPKPCQKSICELNHKCESLCFEECNRCYTKTTKELACGHVVEMACHEDPGKFHCSDKCERMLACGHKCPKKCYEKCGGCEELLETTLPACSHTISVSCSGDLRAVSCTAKCTKNLPVCWHLCQEICGKPCSKFCKIKVKVKASCEHDVMIPCFIKHESPEIISRFCKEPCNSLLPECNHICQGTCGDCRQGRVHVPCKKECEQTLSCGHRCTHPCSQWCPPCRVNCLNSCPHSKCSLKCGQPCVPCVEPCTWQCDHYECSRLCGDLCDRPCCDVPCPKPLKCGHPCIGFCGEPCPPLCRICDADALLETVPADEEINNETRFVYLEDCKHAIEAKVLDRWLNVENKANKRDVKTVCPSCGTRINTCLRYGNILKRMFRDVEVGKQKLYVPYNSVKLQDRFRQSIYGFSQMKKLHFIYFKIIDKDLHAEAVALIESQINILKRIHELKVKVKGFCASARHFGDADVSFLVERLFINRERMTDYELHQINLEIDRIFLFVQMLHVECEMKVNNCAKKLDYACFTRVKEILSTGRVLDVADAGEVQRGLEALERALASVGIVRNRRLDDGITRNIKLFEESFAEYWNNLNK